MRLAAIFIATAFAALPACAGQLTFTLNPAIESGQTSTFPFTVDFTGSLTDTSTLNTCDADSTDCLFLNAIGLDPSSFLPSFLTFDANDFYNNVPGLLSDDGIPAFDSVTTQIFGIQIQPNAVPGTYSGAVDIFGAIDDPGNTTNLLAVADFSVVVVPEPSAWCLAMLGLGALLRVRRVAL
jgi:PEP-CTERM motif